MDNNQVKQQLTHWKQTRDTNYLGSWDLLDGENYKPIILTIAAVKQEVIQSPDNSKSTEVVLHFVEKNYKPMILNTTNKKALEKSTGSGFLEKWVGHKIKIGVEKVKAFGDVFDALRISSTPVQIAMAKCDCCGKSMQKAIYDASVQKYGFGVCSAQCRDKMMEAQNNGGQGNSEEAKED